MDFISRLLLLGITFCLTVEVLACLGLFGINILPWGLRLA